MGNLTVATSRYIQADLRRARSFQIAGRAPRTWKQDRRAWKRFSDYLGSADPWKATAEDVSAWCANMADEGYNPHTIESYLCSISFRYEKLGKGFDHGRMGVGVRKDNPVRAPLVRATLRGIRLEKAKPPVKMLPLMLDTLDKVIDLQPDSLAGIRNRAFLSVGWAAALRASEVRDLDITPDGDGAGYVEFTDDGMVVVLKRSKRNRSGARWERYGIPSRSSAPRYCPRKLTIDWLETCGRAQGTLFPGIRFYTIKHHRMDHHTISDVIRDGVSRLGLAPSSYASRSLRAGCITWLLKEGVHPARVMEHSGHRTLSVMLSYLRSVTAVTSSPLAETRWCR